MLCIFILIIELNIVLLYNVSIPNPYGPEYYIYTY